MDAHTIDFWAVHGILFCLACAVFPRLTLFFLSFAANTLAITPLGILGWFFMPRLTIAIIGTMYYGDTNPLLVVIAWLVAISGEFGEKKIAVRRNGGKQN